MMMQCAVSSRSCGTALSGVAIISLKTLVASDNRSCAVSAANSTTDEQSDNASANLRICDLVIDWEQSEVRCSCAYERIGKQAARAVPWMHAGGAFLENRMWGRQSCLRTRLDRKSTRLNSSHLGISYA